MAITGSGGVIPLYGVVICDALDDPATIRRRASTS